MRRSVYHRARNIQEKGAVNYVIEIIESGANETQTLSRMARVFADAGYSCGFGNGELSVSEGGFNARMAEPVDAAHAVYRLLLPADNARYLLRVYNASGKREQQLEQGFHHARGALVGVSREAPDRRNDAAFQHDMDMRAVRDFGIHDWAYRSAVAHDSAMVHVRHARRNGHGRDTDFDLDEHKKLCAADRNIVRGRTFGAWISC